MEDLRIQRQRWESILRQKLSEFWLKEGDRNTSFFFTQACCYDVGGIKWMQIKEEDWWITKNLELQDCFPKNLILIILDNLEGINKSLVTNWRMNY